MIIDDVFSGLDAINEERIFSRLLGKTGIIRRLGTTVILVTHAAHRLSYADKIVAVSPQGTISEQGTFDQLRESDGYVSGLAARHIVEKIDSEDEKPGSAKPSTGNDSARENAEADLDRPVRDWAVYHYYFTSLGRGRVAVWLGVMALYSVLLLFPGKTIHPSPSSMSC